MCQRDLSLSLMLYYFKCIEFDLNNSPDFVFACWNNRRHVKSEADLQCFEVLNIWTISYTKSVCLSCERVNCYRKYPECAFVWVSGRFQSFTNCYKSTKIVKQLHFRTHQLHLKWSDETFYCCWVRIKPKPLEFDRA